MYSRHETNGPTPSPFQWKRNRGTGNAYAAIDDDGGDDAGGGGGARGGSGRSQGGNRWGCADDVTQVPSVGRVVGSERVLQQYVHPLTTPLRLFIFVRVSA